MRGFHAFDARPTGYVVIVSVGADVAEQVDGKWSNPCGSRLDAVKLLFICMGNICRSPTAEAVMRGLVVEEGLDGQIEIDMWGGL